MIANLVHSKLQITRRVVIGSHCAAAMFDHGDKPITMAQCLRGGSDTKSVSELDLPRCRILGPFHHLDGVFGYGWHSLGVGPCLKTRLTDSASVGSHLALDTYRVGIQCELEVSIYFPISPAQHLRNPMFLKK